MKVEAANALSEFLESHGVNSEVITYTGTGMYRGEVTHAVVTEITSIKLLSLCLTFNKEIASEYSDMQEVYDLRQNVLGLGYVYY